MNHHTETADIRALLVGLNAEIRALREEMRALVGEPSKFCRKSKPGRMGCDQTLPLSAFDKRLADEPLSLENSQRYCRECNVNYNRLSVVS